MRKSYAERYARQLSGGRAKRSQSRRCGSPAIFLWRSAKTRAKKFGWDFNIKPEDVIVPTKCPVFGLELKVGQGKKTDSSPSLDRIDNTRGYVPGNVVVVSWRANRLKLASSLDDLRALSDFYGQINSTSSRMLSEAWRLTHGDRRKAYGDAVQTFEGYARSWTTILAGKLKPGQIITASDVVLLMVSLKIAREARTPNIDNVTDAVGYLILLEEIKAAQ